jgi:uncharacterized protein YjbI with pentapeptide repeats
MRIHHTRDVIDARDAGLASSVFDDVNLAGSTFTNVNLSGARFRDIDLSHVEIAESCVEGMRINGILVTEMLAAYAALAAKPAGV